jgi:hypothetical protein
MIQTIYITSCGLFFPLETLVVNAIFFISVSVHQAVYMRSTAAIIEIFELFVFCGFNVVEATLYSTYEKKSFYSMSVSNKTSIQYIKFVNRLLPTHVINPNLDPTAQHPEQSERDIHRRDYPIRRYLWLH